MAAASWAAVAEELSNRATALSVVSARDDGLWQYMTQEDASGYGLMVWVSDINPQLQSYRTCDMTESEPWVTPAIVYWESLYDFDEARIPDFIPDRYPPHVPWVVVTGACFFDASHDNHWPASQPHNVLEVSYETHHEGWEIQGAFLVPAWCVVPISGDNAQDWASELMTEWEADDTLTMTGNAFLEDHEPYDETGEYKPELCDETCRCGLQYAHEAVWDLTQRCPDYTTAIRTNKADFDSQWQYAIDRWANGWLTILEHDRSTDCCSEYLRAQSPFLDSSSLSICHPVRGPQFRIS